MTGPLDEEGRAPVGDAARPGRTSRHHQEPQVQSAAELPTFEPALAAAGLELIRLRARSKEPAGRWRDGPAMTADAARVHVSGGGNLGVRLRRCDLVVDADPRNYAQGDDPLARLAADHALPDTLRVETGGGGTHLYLRVPGSDGLRGRLPGYAGLDFKTLGGYVVAPGSVHPETGRAYLLDPLSDTTVADAPASLTSALTRGAAADGAVVVAGRHTPEELEAMLEHLDPVNFNADGPWLDLAMACHHATGGAGEDAFIAWSLGDANYSPVEEVSRRRWRSMHADGRGARITERTLYRALTAAGANSAIPVRDDADAVTEVPDAATVDWFRDRGYSLNSNGLLRDTLLNAKRVIEDMDLNPRYDDLGQRVMFLGTFPLTGFGREYGEDLLHVLRLRIASHRAFRSMGYIPSKENLDDAIMGLALERKFNPVVEYLDRLEWDGVGRVERLFSTYFAGADDEYSRGIAVCFMVGAVRRQRQPGCKFDTMPILRSDQGREKSTGIRALFGAEYFTDSPVDPSDKDSVMKLAGNWVVELAELEALKKADVAATRRFLSTDTDNYRAPYARRAQKVARRCVFFGTANESGYLKDMTGNRRFWPVEVDGEVDVAAITRDRDQLWAEAASLEARGVSQTLPRGLWAAAAERQAEQTTVDPLADELAAFLEEAGGDRVSSRELLSALGVPLTGKNQAMSQRVRVLMENVHGWRYARSLRVGERVFAGYERRS